jgi:hypothetical protein
VPRFIPPVVPRFIPPVVPPPISFPPVATAPTPAVSPLPSNGPGSAREPSPAVSPDRSAGPESVREPSPSVAIGVAVAVPCGLVIMVILISLTRHQRRPIIRIIAIPPGEAPWAVRAAWVGLELPLADENPEPEVVPIRGVASGSPFGLWKGYLVDGREAVKCLAVVSPEAAAWWRKHAAHVLERGYQLVFPAAVCHRLGDTALDGVGLNCSRVFISHPDGTIEVFSGPHGLSGAIPGT